MSNRKKRELGLRIDKDERNYRICEDVGDMLSALLSMTKATRRRTHSLFNGQDTHTEKPKVIQDLDSIYYDLISIKNEISEMAMEYSDDKGEARREREELTEELRTDDDD